MSVINNIHTKFWVQTKAWQKVCQKLSHMVLRFESCHCKLSDSLIIYHQFLDALNEDLPFNNPTKKYIYAAFELYLNKSLEIDANCVSYFLNIKSRQKLKSMIEFTKFQYIEEKCYKKTIS